MAEDTGPLVGSSPDCRLSCSQVSTVNLERVRKVKTRHQRLLSRVTTVREELERFLEDDDDMAKMCLTRRCEVRPLSCLPIRRVDCARLQTSPA